MFVLIRSNHRPHRRLVSQLGDCSLFLKAMLNPIARGRTIGRGDMWSEHVCCPSPGRLHHCYYHGAATHLGKSAFSMPCSVYLPPYLDKICFTVFILLEKENPNKRTESTAYEIHRIQTNRFPIRPYQFASSIRDHFKISLHIFFYFFFVQKFN